MMLKPKELPRSQYLWLYLIVLVTLALHFFIIANPPELMFDENHYVNDARHIIEDRETEKLAHPPLGKLFIVAGISILGDNPWGWRIFPVLFGTISIVLFFFICRRLGMSRKATNLATFLLAFENMSFVQAGIAMLDVFFYTFMLAAFLFYLSKRHIFSGISIGLSALAKLSGALALLVIGAHWLLSRARCSPGRMLAVLIMAPVAFIGLMPLFDYMITGQPVNPLARIREMYLLTGSLTFDSARHYALSRPWEWLFSYWPVAYSYMPHYTGGISFSLWMLILPSVIFMIYLARKGNQAALFGAAWFAGTYLFWIPASVISDRISFVYYFYPTIGSICIGLGLGLSGMLEMRHSGGTGFLRRSAPGTAVAFLVFHFITFLVLSPLTNMVSWEVFPW